MSVVRAVSMIALVTSGDFLMQELQNPAFATYIASYLGLLGCYWMLWLCRNDHEKPYRPIAPRPSMGLLFGIWARQLLWFIHLLAGIWYLHHHPALLHKTVTRVQLLSTAGLLLADTWYVNAARPKRPHAHESRSRAALLLVSLNISFLTTLWIQA